MATIQLTIPDEAVSRVIHALCVNSGKIPEDAANAKQALVEIVKGIVGSVERREAEAAALGTIVNSDTEGIVT
jgi:hypothetical protein